SRCIRLGRALVRGPLIVAACAPVEACRSLLSLDDCCGTGTGETGRQSDTDRGGAQAGKTDRDYGVTKRILLIGNFPPPYGGVPTHLAYLAPYLASHGWEVDVLSLKYRAASVEQHDGF